MKAITKQTKMEKRGQVTIFIIIGILIVGAIIAVLLLRRETVLPNPANTAGATPQAVLAKCVMDSIAPPIEIMLPRGGYLEPESYKLFENNRVAFLCFYGGYYEPCSSLEPMYVEHLEQELRNYMAAKIEICFDNLKNDFESRGYTVTTGATEFDIQLQPGQIFIPIKKDFSYTRGSTQTVTKFDTTVSHPLYNLAVLASGIANGEARDCEFDYFKYRKDHQQYDMQRTLAEDGSRIYTLGNEIKLTFAIRGCILPGAY